MSKARRGNRAEPQSLTLNGVAQSCKARIPAAGGEVKAKLARPEPDLKKLVDTSIQPGDAIFYKESSEEEEAIYIKGKRWDLQKAKSEVEKTFKEQSGAQALEKLHGAQLLHGSNSASLMAFTEYGGKEGWLRPLGEIEKKGKIPFSGENFSGRGTTNAEHLSTVFLPEVKSALGYAKAKSMNEKILGSEESELNKKAQTLIPADLREKILKEEKLRLKDWKRLSPPAIKLIHLIQVAEARKREWPKLTKEEQGLAEDNFRVVYGIKPSRKGEVIPQHREDIGEILMHGGASPDEIKVILVPTSRVKQVETLLKASGHGAIPVEPLEALRDFEGGF